MVPLVPSLEMPRFGGGEAIDGAASLDILQPAVRRVVAHLNFKSVLRRIAAAGTADSQAAVAALGQPELEFELKFAILAGRNDDTPFTMIYQDAVLNRSSSRRRPSNWTAVPVGSSLVEDGQLLPQPPLSRVGIEDTAELQRLGTN